jgi:Rrf2 family iron-sulfur cluster assembly transcriptional regulator
MKLSGPQEYGLRCLLVMAKEPNSIHTIPGIAQCEALSKPYVAKLMLILHKGGLVKSIRGQKGGYQLIHTPNQIQLSTVLNCLGGRLYSERFCKQYSGAKKTCVHNADCSLRVLWKTLDDTVQLILRELTLQSLICGEQQMSAKVNHFVSDMERSGLILEPRETMKNVQ